MFRTTVVSLGLALLAAQAQASGITNVAVSGNVVTAELDLPGVQGDVEIVFEATGNLTPTSVGLSADLLSPLDAFFSNRLPTGGLVSLSSAFPVLLNIDPPAGEGLWYRGAVEINLHTHSLGYALGTPLRLFWGPAGGPLESVSAWHGAGSYRVGASSPRFAGDYVIVVDLRTVDEVVWRQIDWLEGVLASNAGGIDPQLTTTLQILLADLRTAVAQDRIVESQAILDTFTELVEAQGGDGIPDLWQAGTTLNNSAGELLGIASALDFGLTWLEEGPL